MSISDIKNGVSQLPPKEQADLAYWIISNLDAITEEKVLLDTAWRQEVRSRVNSIKAGKIEMIPAAKVWEDILGEYVKAG